MNLFFWVGVGDQNRLQPASDVGDKMSRDSKWVCCNKQHQCQVTKSLQDLQETKNESGQVWGKK